MKQLLTIAVVGMLAGCSKTVKWSNRDRTGEWNNGTCYSQFYIQNGTNEMCELGLRSDGVVVWRKRESK